MINPLLVVLIIGFISLLAVNIFILRKIADPQDPFPTYFFGNMFGTTGVAMLFSLVFLMSFTNKLCYYKASVVSVGGCDKSGSCGVKLSDGSYTTMSYPVDGQSEYQCQLEYKDWVKDL